MADQLKSTSVARRGRDTVFFQLLPDLQHLAPLSTLNSIRWSSLQCCDIGVQITALFVFGVAIRKNQSLKVVFEVDELGLKIQ